MAHDEKDSELRCRVVVITGASSGLGTVAEPMAEGTDVVGGRRRAA